MMGFRVLEAPQIRSIVVGLAFALVAFAPPAALAGGGSDLYEFERTGLTNSAISDSGAIIESIFASFNEADNTFMWEAEFLSGDANPSKGYATAASTLPTGFVLVVNDGPMPKGHLGELATLYFEAEELFETGFATGNATLTAYAYNGASSASAHRTSDGRDVQKDAADQAPPDQIVSSRNGFSFDSELGETTNPDGSINRRMKITFDATEIINHTPSQPSIDFMTGDPLPGGWYGLGFAKEIGIWFHPFNKIDPDYYETGPEAGYLTHELANGNDGWEVNRNNYGFFDEDNLEARLVPEPAAAMLLLTGLSLTTLRRKRA